MSQTIAADYDPLNMNEETLQEADASADEASAEIRFSVLREGSDEPIGPLSTTEIFEMLQNGALERSDYVYYEQMEDWQPIDEVFEIQEQISHFVDDGQDKATVAAVFQEVSSVLAQGESIFYIAVQNRTGLLSKSRDSIILTDKRILVLRRKRPGLEIEAFRWHGVNNTLMRDDGNGMATFSILLNLEKRVDINHLPSNQVHRLFQLSQELNDAANAEG